VFEDPDVTHTEESIDAIRDLDIIGNELRLKDITAVKQWRDPLVRRAATDPKLRPELQIYDKILTLLEAGTDVREGEWSPKEVDVLNDLLLLSSKPIVYLVNLSEKDYLRQRNKWLKPVSEWVNKHSPGAQIIPYSVVLETKIFPLSNEEKVTTLAELKTRSMLEKIVTSGFSCLNLINFFTCGEDEVRARTVMKGTKAPQAAGSIHTDFEKCFIKAETMAFADLKGLGSETAVKGAGKYRTEGKTYEVQDGDIMFIKHNAGGGGAKKK